MKTVLNTPYNRFDDRLTTLHEFMLLSSAFTIIMCEDWVSSLLKADVHLADIANCHSPLFVRVKVNESVCVYAGMCVCASLCVCVYSKHTAGKKSQRKPGVIQSDSRPSVSARRNDRGSSDKLFLCLWSSGQHSSFSTSTCDPCLPFFLWKYITIPPDSRFILFQKYQLLILVLGLCVCRVPVCQMSRVQQLIGLTWALSFFAPQSWSCDDVTPKGQQRERLISSLFHISHLPCLGCVSLGKKTDAEEI